MKKTILSVALASASLLAFSSAYAVDSGEITFDGEITSTTCTVHGGIPTNPTGDFTVSLPKISADAFSSTRLTAGSTGYNIYVGAAGEVGCANGTMVAIQYDPNSASVDPMSGRLNLDAGDAPGVQLQVSDALTSMPINLFTNTQSTQVEISDNQATLPFTTEYYASNLTALAAGSVNARVNYVLTYE